MILDPVLGLQGLAVGGINSLIDGLRDCPILVASSPCGRSSNRSLSAQHKPPPMR